MRCRACNKVLTDFELTRKSTVSEDFLDLCNDCYRTIKEDVPTVERHDLMSVDDLIDFNEDPC
jgi:hypothetical protein